MHLQNEPCLESLCFEPVIHIHHCKLYYIRRSALDGHIQRNALAKRSCVEIRRFKLRQIAAARIDRRDISVLLCLFDDGLHIVAHTVVFI